MSDFERKTDEDSEPQEVDGRLDDDGADEVEAHVLVREDEPTDDDRARRRR